MKRFKGYIMCHLFGKYATKQDYKCQVNGYEIDDGAFLHRDVDRPLWTISDKETGLAIVAEETQSKVIHSYQKTMGRLQDCRSSSWYKKAVERFNAAPVGDTSWNK